MIKRVWTILAIMVVVTAVLYIFSFGIPFISTKYELSDYGISLKVPQSYDKIKSKNSSELLHLYNSKNEVSISATVLGKGFWKSDELKVIEDQYIRLLSAAKYDSSLTSVSGEKLTLDNKDVQKVDIAFKGVDNSIRGISILTNAEYNNIAIEFYGTPENIEKSIKEIEKIINSIKLGKNEHVGVEKPYKIPSGELINAIKELRERITSGDK